MELLVNVIVFTETETLFTPILRTLVGPVNDVKLHLL